jgi:hypothetical protein
MTEEEFLKQNWEMCNVGLFNLPGIVYDKDALSLEEHAERVAWSTEFKCGKPMTDRLWSFKTEAHRDWFILKWC